MEWGILVNNIKNDIEFTVLENGLDFILSSTQHIDKKDNNKRNIKYSILHMSSGIELIFKYKLMLTDWKQVFKKVDKADKKNFAEGNFKSIDSKECQNRLKEVCNVCFSEEEENLLKKLREKRNKLEHFAIADSYESLIAYLMKVLNLIVEFIMNNFENDNFSNNESELLDTIRLKIGEIEEFVNHRWSEIKNDVDFYLKHGSILQCPSCFQESLVTDEGTQCLFCGYTDDSDKVATKYIEEISGINEYRTVKDGGIYPQYNCPECGRNSFINNESLEIWKCTHCGVEYNDDEVSECSECGEKYINFMEDDIEICKDCINYKLEKD